MDIGYSNSFQAPGRTLDPAPRRTRKHMNAQTAAGKREEVWPPCEEQIRVESFLLPDSEYPNTPETDDDDELEGLPWFWWLLRGSSGTLEHPEHGHHNLPYQRSSPS